VQGAGRATTPSIIDRAGGESAAEAATAVGLQRQAAGSVSNPRARAAMAPWQGAYCSERTPEDTEETDWSKMCIR